jgi:hypothetical protein
MAHPANGSDPRAVRAAADEPAGARQDRTRRAGRSPGDRRCNTCEAAAAIVIVSFGSVRARR